MSLAIKRAGNLPAQCLQGSAVAVFCAITFAQLIFAYYIFDFYILNALIGNIEQWNSRLFCGLIIGDLAGNMAVGIHLALSFVISICGPIQFIPHFRTCYRSVHRWNGRLYILTAICISLAGLYLLFARGGVSLTGDISLGMNGVLILIFSVQALRFAMRRDIRGHHRWALRLFFTVGGFLFGRLGFQAWIFVTGGAGHTSSYDGPFDVFWGFGMYLVPLAVLEGYFYVRDGENPGRKIAFSGFLLTSTALIIIGTILAFKNIWAPYL